MRINPFDQKSIDKALAKINSYRVEERTHQLVTELLGRGFNVAKVRFSNTKSDGDSSINLSIERVGNTYRLVARGDSVAFIEFGTGIKYNPQGNSSYYGKRPVGVGGIGEYGKGHGATGHRWYYDNGKYSYGNKPAMAMYGATQEILLEVMQIARRVFGD